MNYLAELDTMLPELPKGYEWQSNTYLKDTYQIWWSVRIVRVEPRRMWFSRRVTVRLAEFRGDRGIPVQHILYWARLNAKEVRDAV